ncbi:hypothetical protein ABPG72_014727 [Tetrahymena utriculariae]
MSRGSTHRISKERPIKFTFAQKNNKMERSINTLQQSVINDDYKQNSLKSQGSSLRRSIFNQKQIYTSRLKFMFDCKDGLKEFCLDENINQLIEILQNKDQKEQCDSLYNNLIHQARQEIEVTTEQMIPLLEQSQQCFQQKNFENAKQILYKIFRAQNPLDLQKITDQISKSLDFSKDIVDQEIIIFLGFTGAGKSTLIHYLAGSDIQKITTKNGLTHWEPSNQNPQYKNLDRVVSKADAKSETKFVIPIKIRTKDQKGNEYGEDNEYILCDTPGFHDTDGKESEIANLTAITKCISVCKSIKPVVVISEKQISDKGQGIKNIANVIKRMVKPSQNFQQIVQKFLFVFTKYNKEEDRNELHYKLKNIQENLNLEEQKDQEFISVLNCMLQQTSDKKKIIFFDLTLKGYEFLDQYIQKIKPIQNPKEVFTCFLTTEAENLMGQQLKNDQSRIQTALTKKNFILIFKKMKQLQVLRDNIQDLSLINIQWDQNYALIDKYIYDQIKNVEEIIQQMINSMQIEKEQVNNLLNTKQQFEQIKILQELIPHVDTLIKSYDEALKKINLGILEEVKNEKMQIQQNNLNGQNKKLLVLSEFLKEKTFVKIFLDIVNNKIENLFQNIQNYLKTEKFKDFFDEIQGVINLVQTFEFIQPSDLQNQIEAHLKQVVKRFISLKEQQMKFLQQKNSEDQQNNIVRTHDSIKNIFEQFKVSKLNDQVFKQKITANWKEYTSEIQQIFTFNEKKVINIIKEQSNEFQGLKQKIQQLRLLSKISSKLESRFETLISQINQKVSSICLKVKQVIKEFLYLKAQANLDSKFENLEETLQLIQDCQWVQEYDQDKNLNSQKNEIFSLLRKFASLIVGKLDQIEISLDQTEDLFKIEDSNQKIDKLKKFQDQDEQLKKIIEEYQKEVWKKFQFYFQNIKQFLHEYSEVYWQYEKYFLFLNQCNKFNIYKQEIQSLIVKMKDKMIINTENKKEIFKLSIISLKKIFDLSSLTDQDRNQVEQISKLLYERYDDMLKIERHNTIKNLLKERISEYSIEFQHNQLKRIQAIIKEGILKDLKVEQKWIFILQHLKQIDDLEYKSQPLSTFSVLLSESYQKNKLNVANLKSGFEQKLNSNYLPQILATYQQLKESADQNKQNLENQMILNDLQFQIENEIRKILTQAKQYIDKLKQIITFSPISSQFFNQIENSNQIVSLIKQYDDYVKYFKDHIDLNKFNPTFQQIVSNIQDIAIEVPQKIQQTFTNNNFKESEDQYNFIQEIFKVLFQKFDIQKQLNELQKIKENCLNKLQQKVENLKLDNPRTESFDLKFICSRLEVVEDEQYRDFSKKLKNTYLNKLEKKLNEAKNKPIYQQEEIIKQIQQYFDYIPQETKTFLDQQIEQIKNSSSANQEIIDLFKNKDVQELKKVQETLKNTGQQKVFNEQYSNLIQKESEQAYSQIMQNPKQYTEVQKNLSKLMKITSQSPKEFQQLPKERLNQVFDHFFCDQFKQAENNIQNILNKAFNPSTFDFNHYCNLNKSLLQAKQQLKENELSVLKQTIDSFCIIESIEEQKSKVENSISSKIKQIEENQEDFQNMRDSFNIITQLQHFDQQSYQSLPEIYKKRHNQLQKKMEKVVNQNITQFKIQKQYEQYYENFQKGLNNAQEMQKLAKEINYSQPQVNLVNQLVQKQKQIVDQITQKLEQCLLDNIFDDCVAISINNVFLNSKYIGEYLPNIQNKIDEITVQQKFKQKIKEVLKEPQHSDGVEELNETSQYLSDLNKLSNTYIYMEKVKAECDESINQTLKKYKDSKGSIEKLQIQLRQYSKYGHQITKNHPFFKGFQISDANLKLQRLDMKNVLDKIKGYFGSGKKDDLNTKQLDEYNKKFLKKYDEYLSKYLTYYDKIDFIALSKDIYKSVNNIELQKNGIIEQTSLGGVPDLLAGIFACWTCLNSKYYFESKKQSYENQESFLLKPTSAQLVAIFRLLGIGYSTRYDQIQPNGLAQILTGEGKSVILAVLSSFYALFGFSVKCACYSNQLSTRDYEDFSPLFEKLQLNDFIFYGTFNKVCEQLLNDRGDIREQISNFIQFDKIQFKNASDLNKQVLLIDEVDVFFSKEFFGNNYDIVAPIQDETIEKLLDKIWSEKVKPNFSFKSISESDQFKQCLAKFPKWSELIQEQVKIIVHDFKNFNDIIVENYKTKNDKIYYKNQDQYVDNISFGYRTLYSYYQEKENNRISEVGLKRQKMFKINCGSFSYSELPKKFLMIKGVTGTLETLSKSQLELIQKSYNINQYTLVPSVYGDSKFTFNKEKDVKVTSQQEYFNNITNEINKNMAGKRSQQRAVLVFFSTKENLMEYHDSEQFRCLKTNFKIQIMTEENTIDERKQIIQDATYSGTITMMTRIFCRGIDFRVLDTTLFQNYGIHVIQTFFSEDKSEEIQAKGRTARQGEEGSYSIILEIDMIQAFLKSDEEKHKMSQNGLIYDIIDSNRQANFENDFKSNMLYNQKTSITNHKQSETFLTLLKNSKQAEVKKYLLQLNLGSKESQISKTLIALDATGSMSGLITQAKNTIQTTFEQARDILQEKGYDPQCFLVMISFFRSYSSKWDGIFQTTAWENNADKLRSFLQTVEATGGTDPGEAVEVGLWWANKQNDESPINQVIVLGDQPANLENEAQYHRDKFGQSYWDTTPLKGVSYYVPECNKLKIQNVPVHTFYLNNRAKNIYEDISNITGGQSAWLDIKSDRSAKILTQVLVEQILIDIGKEDGRSEELVMAYKAKYS